MGVLKFVKFIEVIIWVEIGYFKERIGLVLFKIFELEVYEFIGVGWDCDIVKYKLFFVCFVVNDIFVGFFFIFFNRIRVFLFGFIYEWGMWYL